jgi:hypothetical protein
MSKITVLELFEAISNLPQNAEVIIIDGEQT